MSGQSLLLRLDAEADARAIEATLKRELAELGGGVACLGAARGRRSDGMVQRRAVRPCRGAAALFPCRARGRARERTHRHTFVQRVGAAERIVRAMGLEPGAAGVRRVGVRLHAEFGAGGSQTRCAIGSTRIGSSTCRCSVTIRLCSSSLRGGGGGGGGGGGAPISATISPSTLRLRTPAS